MSQPKPDKKAGKSTTMRTKIYAPFKVYYDGQASSVSAANRVGVFDILPQHHNFISLLEPGDVIVRSEGKDDFSMKITRGIMHVKADIVRVFLDI
jgi:F0F1-type ATP synthase epsilon subunit